MSQTTSTDIARHPHERKTQRALMQFFKPENYFEVRQALIDAHRDDLIGDGCDSLIPATPPKEAIKARRRAAQPGGDHYHTVPNPSKPARGYRPHRASKRRS